MAITNATRLSDFAAGIGTEGAILQIDNANQRVGIGTQLPSQMLEVAGIVTATAFYGDGSNLEGVASAGLGTAIGDSDAAEAVVYYTDDILSIGATLTIDVPPSSSAGYTQYRDIKLDNQADLIVETGDDFIPDVLGLSSSTPSPDSSGNGVFDQVYADIIKNKNGLGAPAFANGLTSVGVITATKFIGSGVDLTNLNATQLTSGTIDGARFPATLPAASGVNLTSLNGFNISSGIVTSSVLGGGTANATTFLNGHGQFAEPAGAGQWTFLGASSGDISNGTDTIDITTSLITSTYYRYKLVFNINCDSDIASGKIGFRFRVNSAWESAAYYRTGYRPTSGTMTAAYMDRCSLVNEDIRTMYGEMILWNPSTGSNRPHDITITGVALNNRNLINSSGYWSGTTIIQLDQNNGTNYPITGIQFSTQRTIVDYNSDCAQRTFWTLYGDKGA